MGYWTTCEAGINFGVGASNLLDPKGFGPLTRGVASTKYLLTLG